jgi:hypothetical protein
MYIYTYIYMYTHIYIIYIYIYKYIYNIHIQIHTIYVYINSYIHVGWWWPLPVQYKNSPLQREPGNLHISWFWWTFPHIWCILYAGFAYYCSDGKVSRICPVIAILQPVNRWVLTKILSSWNSNPNTNLYKYIYIYTLYTYIYIFV